MMGRVLSPCPFPAALHVVHPPQLFVSVASVVVQRWLVFLRAWPVTVEHHWPSGYANRGEINL